MTTAPTELCTYTLADAVDLARTGAARTVYVRAAPARLAAKRRRWPRLAARVALAGAIGALLGSPQRAHAQTLPCGDTGDRSYTLRWRASPTPEPVKYALKRGSQPGPWPERVDIDPQPVAVDGVYSQGFGGFTPTRSWWVSIVAIGEGGESEPSNPLELPALVSGPCLPPPPPPKPPPPPPTLIEVIEGLVLASEEQTRRLRDVAERLRAQALR